MSDTIVLYTHPWSRGRMARWMLEECGAEYEVQVMGFDSTLKGPEYAALNPMGKVPTLRWGDAVITETAAICAYLADQFPDKQLAPPLHSPERGTYYRWLFFCAGPVEAATTAKSLGLLAPPEKRVMVGYGRYEDVMNTLEHACRQALARGGFLCGQFSAADLYLAGHLSYGLQFKSIEPRPVFEQYLAPILARPAYVKASALDNALGESLQNKAE